MEHYVYAYLNPLVEYPDVLGINVFKQPIYIGKGKLKRSDSHWDLVKSDKPLTNSMFNSVLKKIKDSGFSPIIIKIRESMSDSDSKILESELISIIGRKIKNTGPLLNITDGGDGGITWIDKHPAKGKKLEELYGFDKSNYMKKILSECASQRTGDKNPMYGRVGVDSPLYSIRKDKEFGDKVSKSLKNFFSSCDPEYINSIVDRLNSARSKIPDDIRMEWYCKISDVMKRKYDDGQLFNDAHRDSLSKNHYRKKNAGSLKLKASEKTRKMMSNSRKNVKLSEKHKANLRIFKISYDDLKLFLSSLGLKSKIQYREYIKMNNINAPLNPGKKIYGEKWEGWKIFLNKN
jgi:hypothetical protein